MATTKPIQYTVGIEDLYICMMTTEETAATAPVYDNANIYQQTNISTLTISATSTNFTKWASNKKIINITKNSSFSLAFGLAGLNREVKDKIFGKTRNKGITFEKSEAIKFPSFAVGLVFPLDDGSKVVRWYPKCTIAPAEETYNTQNEEMTVDDVAYTITADPLLNNDVSLAELDTGSTDAVTEAKFLEQVVYDESQIAALAAAAQPTAGGGAAVGGQTTPTA